MSVTEAGLIFPKERVPRRISCILVMSVTESGLIHPKEECHDDPIVLRSPLVVSQGHETRWSQDALIFPKVD